MNIFNKKNQPNFLSLKEPSWQVNLHPKHLKSVFLKKSAFLCYSLVFILAFFIFLKSNQTKAENALFYPTSCLGGWENVDKATNLPDLKEGDEATLFNNANSAVLKNTNGEIYCGSFAGEIPKESAPKKFYLSFSWTMDDGNLVHPEPQPFTPVNTDVVPTDLIPIEGGAIPLTEIKPVENIPEIIELPIELSTELPTELPKEIPENIPVEIPPPVENQIENTPQSFLESFVNTAYAEDIPIEMPVIEEKTENISEQNPVPENFLKITYTLDGVTWLPLAEINRSNWKNAKFLLPLATWDDLSKMQISIKSVQSFDVSPVIYLDAMNVEVEYESLTGVIVASPYHIFQMQSNTPNLDLTLSGHPPEREYLTVSNVNNLAGLAVYNTDTGEFILNANVNAPSYDLDAEYFGVGNFTVINTSDEGMCTEKTLKECLSDENMMGNGNFSIVEKTMPTF